MNSFHIPIFALALRYSIVLLSMKLIKLQGQCEREKSDINWRVTIRSYRS
jgi:hypothetical protein